MSRSQIWENSNSKDSKRFWNVISSVILHPPRVYRSPFLHSNQLRSSLYFESLQRMRFYNLLCLCTSVINTRKFFVSNIHILIWFLLVSFKEKMGTYILHLNDRPACEKTNIKLNFNFLNLSFGVLFPTLIVWPWKRYATSLSPDFLVFKMGLW